MSAGQTLSSPRALRLASPRGGRPLFGLDGDRVFSSPGEAVAYELVESSLDARTLSAAEPERSPEGEIVWLPFWRVQFRAVVSGEGPAVSVVQSVFDQGAAYVRAFSLLNALYVGDPGLGFTLDGYEPRTRREIPPVCLGARLPSREAVSVARLFLLEKADRVTDVTGARVAAEVSALEILLVPFDRVERSLVMLVGRATRFREETVSDLRGIEATLRRMKGALR